MDVDQLSVVFGALADPTRRAILAGLAEGDANGRGARGAVHHLAARGLEAPAGARGGGAHLAPSKRATARLSHLEAEPLRAGDGVAGRLPRVLGGELRAARRAARAPPGATAPADDAGRRRGRDGSMTTRPPPAHRHRRARQPLDHHRARVRRPARPRLPLLHRARAARSSGSGRGAYEMRVDEYDFRDGGRYRYVTRTEADGNEYGFHGVFHGDAVAGLDASRRSSSRARRATSRWTS